MGNIKDKKDLQSSNGRSFEVQLIAVLKEIAEELRNLTKEISDKMSLRSKL